MKFAFLATGCAALGLADLAWIDLALAPKLAEAEGMRAPAAMVKVAEASPQRSAMTTVREVAPAPAPTPTAVAERVTAPVPERVTAPVPERVTAVPERVTAPVPERAAVPERVTVAFEFDNAEPSDAAKQSAAVLAALAADPALVVVVDGHTDRTGAAAYNDRLSRARADAVAARLVASGVPSTRIRINGHGARKPLASGNDATSLARNRRVELSFERRSP